MRISAEKQKLQKQQQKKNQMEILDMKGTKCAIKISLDALSYRLEMRQKKRLVYLKDNHHPIYLSKEQRGGQPWWLMPVIPVL